MPKGGRRKGLSLDEERSLLGNDFRLVLQGPDRLAQCRVCPERDGHPISVAKVQQHRDSLMHQRRVRDDARSAVRRDAKPAAAEPGPEPPATLGSGSAAVDHEHTIFDDEPVSHPTASFRPPTLPMRPVPVPNRINEAMKLHHRGSLQPLSMWTADTVVESESDGEEELVERLASEISIINLASSEHEDWSPFPSKQTLYALLICQNPRHIMSVPHQQMILSFGRAAVHSYAKGARQDGVPSQKALEACRRQLRATLDAPPLKEISSGSGNVLFCSSIAAAIARDFANPSARSAMVFYPRQTATIETF
ncbi:unnamed protein product [Tilletia controversa]|uniref:Uncharacterized protein n=1 Tax=Tilletia controversa TaxID=13291 RepID=A0A8X7ML57_9BASI|nr:hypothetical protein A4X06_0g8297 [Tilletia controversa]CAD6967377.1 unnamed protein product [Tilletia controversa]CAD7066363.1 unnamed protein product [Tilletia caries]